MANGDTPVQWTIALPASALALLAALFVDTRDGTDALTQAERNKSSIEQVISNIERIEGDLKDHVKDKFGSEDAARDHKPIEYRLNRNEREIQRLNDLINTHKKQASSG